MSSTQRVALTCTLTYLNGSSIFPVANQQVTVIKRSGGAATVFSSVSAGSPVSTITTDVSGNLNGSVNSYFVAEGSYIIQVPGSIHYSAFNVYFEAVHGDGVGNLDSSVGSLTGDASGTLPNVTINTIQGQPPVTQATALGGILAGTLPNPTAASVLQAQLVPAGTIIEHAGAIAPAGYLPALGGAYSRSTYATLLSAIAITKTVSFGSGVTTITIPDVTLEPFIQGLLGFTNINVNIVYGTSIPVSGTGIGASNTNTITSVEFTSTPLTILTLASPTLAIESSISLLFAPHGVGDGSTTFNVPNRAGIVGIGAGTGPSLTERELGNRGGEENHTLSMGALPASGVGFTTGPQSNNHSHGGTTNNSYADGGNGAFQYAGVFDQIVSDGLAGGGDNISPIAYHNSSTWGNNSLNHSHGFTTNGVSADHTHPGTTNNLGNGNSHNNMQPFGVFSYFIKT
jgi:microcystin-dependent protein